MHKCTCTHRHTEVIHTNVTVTQQKFLASEMRQKQYSTCRAWVKPQILHHPCSVYMHTQVHTSAYTCLRCVWMVRIILHHSFIWLVEAGTLNQSQSTLIWLISLATLHHVQRDFIWFLRIPIPVLMHMHKNCFNLWAISQAPSFTERIIFIFMHVCALESQRKALHPLEVKLQSTVKRTVWVLAT